MKADEQINNLANFGESILEITSPIHAIGMINNVIAKLVIPDTKNGDLETEIWYLTQIVGCFTDLTEHRLSKGKTLKDFTGVNIDDVMYRKG